MEPGEGLEESLVREIREELCLDIRVLGLFKNICQQDRDFAIDLHAFWCEICGGTLCLVEHVAFMWANISELKRMDFTKADRLLIPHLEGLAELPSFQRG